MERRDKESEREGKVCKMAGERRAGGRVDKF